MNPGEIIQLGVVATLLAFGAGFGLVVLRLIWKRTDRPAGLVSVDMQELQTRVAELEAERGRIAELEERVDFAERLLAQAKPEGALPSGRG